MGKRNTQTKQGIHRGITKSQSTELPIKCWEETAADVSEWWVTDPIDLSEIPNTTIPLTPRYAIREQYGNQLPKIRLVDDFRSSDINAIIETDDTNIPDSLGPFVDIASYSKILAPGFQLMCETMDFYRRGGVKRVV